MSFLKGFKEDFSRAMNELMPESNEMYDDVKSTDVVQNKGNGKSKKNKKKQTDTKTKQEAIDIAAEDLPGQIDDLIDDELYGEEKKVQALLKDDMEENTTESVQDLFEQVTSNDAAEAKEDDIQNKDMGLETLLDSFSEGNANTQQENEKGDYNMTGEKDKDHSQEVLLEDEAAQKELTAETEDTNNEEKGKDVTEEIGMGEEKEGISVDSAENVSLENKEEKLIKPEDLDADTTYITKGTVITGDIDTDGSIDIIGTVEGNVSCKGKIVVGGEITGSINAGELYANNAKIQGDIKSTGSVKIGVGSVIVGNIEGESAVIAGAVHGDLDVKGPVIVDSTAVIMGNIKSKSVQINNGAVIEGFCSQSYSDIDVKSFFA